MHRPIHLALRATGPIGNAFSFPRSGSSSRQMLSLQCSPAPPSTFYPASRRLLSASTYVSSSDRDLQTTRRRLRDVTIAEVLQRKHTERWVDATISKSDTVSDAMQVVIERNLGALMVVDRESNLNTETHQKGKVLGMMTSRDLLRRFSKGKTKGRNLEEVGREKVETLMTPLNKVVYGRPEETVGQARDIMSKVGVKCLPIMSKEGR